MKVYRGFNNDIGPISYADWIYVTPDLEQAKWYANRDGQIKNGSVIQYDIDDNLNFFSIDNVNDVMKKYDESYSIDDLLWYQEGLSDYLYKEGADGIKFIDPKYNEHIIYILFDENYLKNGKLLNKKPLKEAYIKGEKGNIYYTKNSDMFLSIIKNTFISKNIPVRVYYDTIKQIYVFGDAFNYIHADLATNMKYYSKVYGVDEMRVNISYLKQNCALFQVLPDDDFKKYDMGDGYTKGWFLKLDDLIFACRSKEYEKVRDKVPLFKDHIGEWVDVQYYLNKKNNINESIEDKILYIIRGVPGSGKSTLAHKLTDNVVEADQYFYDDKGNYNWSADKLNQAHNWCFYTVKKYMEEGRDKIAVANTFVKNKDYKRYVELAKEFGYKVDIRTCTGNYQNIHNVPDETVEKMRSKFQETPLDESVKYLNKEYSDTKIITSNYDMRDYLNNHKNLRIVYDKLNKWYFVNDSEKAVHFNIMSDAIKAGFYNDYKVKSGIDLLLSNYYEQFVVFVVNDGSVPADAFDADDYIFEYKYDTFNIYDRDGQFINCPLYQILGMPNETNRIDGYNEDEDNENYYDEDENPLNEELIFASKKDLSDFILKNPTKKELKDFGIEEARCMEDSEGNWYFSNALHQMHYEMAKIIGDCPLFNDFDCFGIAYYNIKRNEFKYNLNDYLHRKDCIKQYEDSEYLKTNFPNATIVHNPFDVEHHDEDEEEQLDESAENDKTLRDYAVKLANICLDALVKTKYETKISKEQVQINVDKAFKKAVPILKYSSYEYFLLLVNEKDEPNPSFGKTVDKKYGLITFPIFSSDPSDLALSILYKHKSVIEKLYTTYSGDELKLKIHEYAVKYLKNEIKKRLEDKKNIYLDLLIHECTHLLDDVRRTKTYKSKEQELKDDKGIEDYYNSPEEQNAYYQETISIFDEWANQSVGYKTFNIFWDDFIRQYKGEYNMLNDKNKRKLKKRAYTYWYVYMKD